VSTLSSGRRPRSRSASPTCTPRSSAAHRPSARSDMPPTRDGWTTRSWNASFSALHSRPSRTTVRGARMGVKRALIVDDSKSARVFLSRILEKYEIDVDSAENAEAAIEYLGHHRPDVIFMDHMMPGMDGFQAVQAIKNNPRTAMIPIM